MMFKVRTSPVLEGTQPYAWDVASIYQCTWYCYYRALECGMSAPTWWDRETKVGSYPNAKDWLDNVRDPWEAKGVDYIPKAGDILVYTNNAYGHVIFCESDTLTSEYRSGDKNSFRNAKIGDYKGELLGILHYPYESVLPVERNTSVNQIECKDDALRIRTGPGLNYEIVGHVQLGFYNVLNQAENDGYTWYEISKDRWCANITTNYLPKAEDDFVRQLEKFLNDTKAKINALEKENEDMKADYSTIKNIAERWV